MSTNVFVYNGTPGQGNLVGAVTDSAGVDAYGNQYLAGNGSYITIGTETFAQVSDGGNTIFGIYQNGAWTYQGEICVSYTGAPHSTTGLMLSSQVITVSSPIAIMAPQTLAWPNNGGVPCAEYWHDLRPFLANGFTAPPAGYTPPQVRVTATGDAQLLGWVTLPISGSYTGTVFAQLPALQGGPGGNTVGYIPPTLATVSVRTESGVNTSLTGTPYTEIDTAGNMKLRKLPLGMNGDNINISGSYPVTGYITA